VIGGSAEVLAAVDPSADLDLDVAACLSVIGGLLARAVSAIETAEPG
jgi:hypothetical protein